MSVKVSIIIAVNNDEHNLKSALDSIKSQSFKDIEVIMIDAASNDSSPSIMKSYLNDKRFSYQRVETNSISGARNIGMSQAKGKYLAFGDASVIFSKRLIEGMYECAEKEDADLCVAPMASSDVYGKHEFKSTGILSRRKKTNKFDTDLIWNPAVTNKLFLKSRVEQLGLKFNAFGKAREAAFTLPFAFASDVIACSSKGAASYIIPVQNDGVAQFPIQHYLDAYKFIIEMAEKTFDKAVAESVTDFDRKELKKVKVCYIDQVFLKEITVLLYSYYRHFWSLEDDEIKEYTDIISSLIACLSSSGKKTLLSINKDIFYDGRLIDNKSEMAENPKVTVCIGKSEKRGHLHEKRLLIQVTSIFNQTMPGFKLFVDERLRDIFPKKWINYPNVEFIEAKSLAEFKDLALEKCPTKYIMYQDGFARLNPKILMRHYMALEGREKYGFTTSPLTRFDGNRTEEYSFSDLSFYSDMKVTRASESNNTFVLDLFFCNKLFRTDHLNGIHFTFSDNPVIDMYKLYEHSRFKKLLHRGAYLPYNEEEALSLLKAEQRYLPNECKIIYKKYKSVYRKRVTSKKRLYKAIKFAKAIKRFIVNVIDRILVFVFSHMKIKNRAFFYTIRSNDKLLENSRFVYDGCDCSKVMFAKMLPHSFIDACKAKFYMLTSKVIVTDDYLKYLRSVRLREGQKVIQIWHASGAFKRFGLDAPSRLSRIEEYSTHSQYSDVCVSSEYVRQFYAHAFGVDIDVVKALGSPRTDGVVDTQEREDKRMQIITRHPLLKDKKVYVYFPTFRETDGVLNNFDPKIDWAKLNDELADDEVFIISRHPVMKEEFFKNAFYSRIKDYTFEPSPDLLAIANVVITDYSSIIFDASLLNMPLVFYCPDYDEYEREFYLNYEEDLPGSIVKDSNEMLGAIREALEKGSETEKIKRFKELEVGACDGHSTERVVNLIKGYLSE
ncbi:MAG: bifunctional glycosyltransferase family 2 protein/CDP-glycerol:glycerophosphate glycerophosphotransferase [Faecalibacterium sp.]|nr:bifunctional glycosyltransferase family 2 protein/CDP-glycerol:glycerophosphate glycerophosphotransferase [Ruminococcus sp.]MCM1391953.1 bifunctional glycosyltransferase family 2 protein/CDP-glycerol:glycerophosphate glycerophosphotransferase [Ruminococcus sp.]MCM1484981.1 bifunctional glycosyltransferase family 2 protein/CDP-glycerol:glycerophosphate glycerophosphotransferase [Faecalibacterium sp.]